MISKRFTFLIVMRVLLLVVTIMLLAWIFADPRLFFNQIILSLLLAAQVQANEAPLGPTLSKIADAKGITLGYRDASVPFSYVGDYTGQPMGYSVDLAGKIVERIEQKLASGPLKVPAPLPVAVPFQMLRR